MAIGAGDVARARRVAWIAGGLSAFNLGLIGLVVSVAPDLWATLFSSDEAVLEHARQYLRINGQWADHLLFALLRADYDNMLRATR